MALLGKRSLHPNLGRTRLRMPRVLSDTLEQNARLLHMYGNFRFLFLFLCPCRTCLCPFLCSFLLCLLFLLCPFLLCPFLLSDRTAENAPILRNRGMILGNRLCFLPCPSGTWLPHPASAILRILPNLLPVARPSRRSPAAPRSPFSPPWESLPPAPTIGTKALLPSARRSSGPCPCCYYSIGSAAGSRSGESGA